MAAELGVGYVSIIPDASKITPGIKKALGDAEPEYGKAGDKGGTTLGSRLMGAAGKTMKAGGLAAGAAAGGAITVGITKGIGRLNAIEQAESKLTGLGNSGQKVGSIMEDALASVKGTAYGLGDAATVAASAVAAGVQPGEDLERTLKLVGDAAAIAGTDLSEMGSIFNKVATSGKVQGDVLNQLSDQGIPIVQLLAEEIGVTAEEVYKLGRDGEINFEIFRNAIETGMGGAALETGNTTQGALANVGAAAGRLGATLAGPFFTQAQGAFVGVTAAIDEMNDHAAPAMREFGEWFSATGIPAMQDFASESWETFQAFYQSGPIQNALADTARSFSTVVEAGVELVPVVGQIGTELGKAAGALGLSGWKTFTGVLQITGTALEAVAGPLGTVADFMSDHPGLVQAAVLAYAGFKTVPTLMGRVADGIGRMTGASSAMVGMEKPAEKMQAAMSPLTGGLRDATGTFKEAAVQAKAFGAAHPEVSKLGVATQALSNNVPFIQRMGEAYQTSSAGLKSYATEQRLAAGAAKTLALSQTDVFTSADALGRQMGGTLRANIASAAGTARGVGAAGFSAMRSAVEGAGRAGQGLLTAMGGPWGVTLAVGGAAVATVASEMQRWNRFQEASEGLAKNSTRAYDSMFGAIGSGADKVAAMTSTVEEWKQSLDAVADTKPPGALMWAQENVGRIAGLGTAVSQLTSGWKEEADAQNEVAQSAENVEKAMTNLGLTNEDIATKVTASDAEYKRFTNSLREQGGEAVDLANHMQSLRDGFEDAQDMAKRMGPEASALAASVREIAASSDDAETKTRNFMRAMAEFNGVQLSQAEASGELTRTIDDTADALIRAAEGTNDFAGATLDARGMIDTTTTAGDALNTAFTDMAEQMWQAAASGEEAQSVWDRSQESLYGLGDAAGLSKEDVDDLIEAFGLFPETLRTHVRVDGDAAKMELQVVAEQVGALQGNGPYDVDIDVNDSETVAKLENAGWLVRSYDEEKGEANLYLNDEESIKKFEWWQENGFPALDMANPTAEANLDTTGLGFNAHYAQMQLNTIDQERPNPLASMDISLFTEKQIKMLNDVNLLDGMKPNPDASMNIAGLEDHQKAALAMVVDLSKKEAIPIAKLLGMTEFKNNTDAAKRYLDSIPSSKGVTIQMSTEYLDDTAKLYGGAENDPSLTRAARRAQGRAGGGRLPKNSRGSRLPTSGPGTDRTDGILGISADGTPMSWVDAGEWIINADSSEKYDALLSAVNADDPEAIAAALPQNAGGGRAGALSGAANLTMGMDLEGILAEQAQGTTFDPLMQSWQTMAQGMQDADSSILAPTLANLQAGISSTGAAFTSTVQGVVNPQVLAMGNHLMAVKAGIVDPALAGVRAGLDLTGQWMTNTVQGTLNPQWSGMGNHLAAVKNGSVLPTFSGIQSGIDTLAGWFSTGVGNMSSAFGRLRGGTGAPGKFVVHDVFNQGIRGAWNAIADLIDAKPMGPVPLGALGGYATGGVLPGYTPGRDVHMFSSPTGGQIMLSGGEAIMRPEWTRAVGGPAAVDRMNSDARRGKFDGASHAHANGGVLAFANGGVLPGSHMLTTDIQRAMMNSVAKAFPNQQITSGTRYADVGSGFDNHMAGRAIDFAPSQALASWIKSTYPRSAELFWDPGPNIKNGAPTGAIGGHSDHVHWAMSSIVNPYTGKVISMGGPGDGGAMVSITDMVKEQWDDEIGKIKKWPGGHGRFGSAVPKLQNAMESKAWKFVESQADKIMVGPGSPAGGGAERWRPTVRKAMTFQGEPKNEGHVSQLVRQIDNESDGDEKAIQQIVDMNGTGINAGGGLLQFIPSTWASFRDPRLPDDRFNGWANINAGVRYARDKHGWGPIVGSPGGWKDGGVLPANLPAALFDTGGFLNNGEAAVNMSGSKEPVFTASQWAVLKQSITANAAMADPLKKWVDGGISAIERVANGVEAYNKGWSEWAAADEERGRIGNAEELAIHFGGAAAKEFAGDALSLIGLDGLANIKFSESFVDLVNAASDTADDLWDIRLGHINQDSAQPASLLDADLRNPRTKVEPEKEEPPTVEEPAEKVEPLTAEDPEPETLAEPEPASEPLTEPLAAEDRPLTADSTEKLQVNITLQGDAYSADEVEKLLKQINSSVDGIDVRVERLEKAQMATVVAGIR